MSLLDLKSDLSKYRWKGPNAPVDPDSRTPRALTYGDNFASFQPISNTFIPRGDLPKMVEPRDIDLVDKLGDTRLDDIQNTLTDTDVTKKLGTTRLDDIQKPIINNILVNSVSQLSPQNKEYNVSTFGRTSVTDVVSQLSRIDTDVTQTNITESKVDVIKRDNQSGNIKIPDVVITPQEQILNKSSQAPFIIKDPTEAVNNIRIPLIPINVPKQTKDREEESPNINNNPDALDLLINNDPLTILQSSQLDLNGTPIKYLGNTKFIGDLSNLNLDAVSITNPSGRHETDSNSNLSNKDGQQINQFPDDNASGFTTNAQPLQTEYRANSSTLGYDTLFEANYFDVTNTHTRDGFHAFAQPAEPTKYKVDSSAFDWDGITPNAPSVNYFDVNNKNTTEGFHTFSRTRENTRYKVNSSDFDWDGITPNAPSVNYFDRNNLNTIQGFHTFAFEKEDTKYKVDSSRFDWDGDRSKAPSVDYFDIARSSTVRGFHNFAVTKEPSSYATEPTLATLSVYNNRAVILRRNATRFDWDGFRTNAPSVNFFDLSNPFATWRGFHTFANTQEPTSYRTNANNQLVLAGGRPVILSLDASRLDWNGFRRNAPAVNYFDFFQLRTWRGFHRFAFEREPTSYQTTANGQLVLSGGPPVTLTDPASLFDWNGLRPAAPAVNFFDLGPLPFRSTWRGFHTFAFEREATSYNTTANGQIVLAGGPPVTLTNFATFFDWNGLRAAAPAVNFFDLRPLPLRATWRGFHTFAFEREPTSYNTTANGQLVLAGGPPVTLSNLATFFDWNGVRAAAPAVNFFDFVQLNTWRGFHTFAQPIEPTSYQTTANGQIVAGFTAVALGTGATQFAWNGFRQAAPAVNYFDFANQFTFQGFHTFAFEREPTSYQVSQVGNVLTLGTNVSRFTWGGLTSAVPVVNYFDLVPPFKTRNAGRRGFHAFAVPQEPTAFVTTFATPTTRTLPVYVGALYWSGARTAAPAVDYFDQNRVRTTRGFHILARELEPTSYQTRLVGGRLTLTPTATRFDWSIIPPAVNFFPNTSTTRGFHTFAFQKQATSYRTFQVGLIDVLDPFASFLDWDSPFLVNTPQQPGAPAVNYFDLSNRSTTRGFHIFAFEKEQTSYRTTAFGGARIGLHQDASFLDWNGNRASAPAVNYFPFTNIQPLLGTGGFRRFFVANSITRYNTGTLGNNVLANNATSLDWDGLRGAAPGVNYFDVNNISTTRGFQTLAYVAGRNSAYRVGIGFSQAAGGSVNFLAPGATAFDWDGFDPYSMRTTNFFGFTSGTRFGFMVNMSQFDGTAYPIITPRFNANLLNIPGLPQRLQRFALATIRQIAQPLNTRNLEQFAPLTLGGKTISGFRSTLDVQIPVVTIQKLNLNIAANRVRLNPGAPNFTKRYTTGGGVDIKPNVVDGNMESWANNNNLRFPIPAGFGQTDTLIDRLQSKYKLRDEAYNTDLFGIRQPFIDDSLRGQDAWSTFSFDDGLVRGGIVLNTASSLVDSVRIGKFLLSGRGLLFNIKQSGLQAMNPNVDKSILNNPLDQFLNLPSIISTKAPTQFYNPLSILRNVLEVGPLGKRYTRHGISFDGLDGKYEGISIERALSLDNYEYFDQLDAKSNNNYNRLIGLVKELLPNSYDPIRQTNIPQKNTKLEISRISSGFGGPNSLLGFFGTSINRAKHPFKIVNTTEYFPDKISIGLGFDREVFFSGRYENSATQPDTYASMLSRELREYQGDMYGLILSAANISSQAFTPTWSESSKNIFDAKNIKFQLFSQDRINSTRVFDFKKPTTNERFHAMNSGYIPYRDYNESIAEEIFFRGPEFGLTYFDRLFGNPNGEFTKYNGEVFGIVLGATLGQSGSFTPYWPFGPVGVKSEEFNIPLNKYDAERILKLNTFSFKQSPITERGRAIISTNIVSRENLIDLASDIMFFKGSALNNDTSITLDFYGNFLKIERTNFSGNTFGLVLALGMNEKILGKVPYWKDSPEVKYSYDNIRINSKTKTLLQKIQPFKFLVPSEKDRYSAITSETATDYSNTTNATSLLDLIKYGTETENKVPYGKKLKNDHSNFNGEFTGLILAASLLGLKAVPLKATSARDTSDGAGLMDTGQRFGTTLMDLLSTGQVNSVYGAVGAPRFTTAGNVNSSTSPNEIIETQDAAQKNQFIDESRKNIIKKLSTFEFKYPSDYERLEALTNDNIDRESNNRMALGPNKNTYASRINKFSTLDYFQLGEPNRSMDFRSNLIGYEFFSANPRAMDYVNLNLEKPGQFSAGMGGPGRLGNLKAFPFISNIHYTSGLSDQIKSRAEELANKSVLERYYIANRRYGAYPTEKSEVAEFNASFGVSDNSFWNSFRGDRINVIDWKRQEVNLNIDTVYEHEGNANKSSMLAAQDSIQFYFSGVDLMSSAYRPTEALVFRAHIDTIVDNHKPTWTPIKYIGRADPVYSYDGYEREISFGFTIHIGSRDELKATWRKLNMLASWTSPDYIDPGFMKAPICRLNIGNLYRKFPGFISTLNYTFDNTITTWETAKLAEDLDIISQDEIIGPDGKAHKKGKLSAPGALELPKTIIVQCTFVTFNIYRPQWDCVFYSLFDDRRGVNEFENGLVPMSSDRVNYFRTHDDLPMQHPMNALLCSVVPPPPIPPTPPKPSDIPEETTSEIITTTPPTTTPPTTTPPPTGTVTPPPTSTVTPPPTPTPTPGVTTTPPPPCVCKIDFCFDEDREITPPSRTTVRSYVEWLRRCPDLKVKITGYCSKEAGNEQYNLYLSWARATTVANLLVEEFGIDPNRLVVDGQGFGPEKAAVGGITKRKWTNRRTKVTTTIKQWKAQGNRRVTITPISGETVGCEAPKECPAKQCPVTKTCWRKDGTKFWRVGPHYFTGTALIEENGKNVGQTYTGWPQGWPDKNIYSEPRMTNKNWQFLLPPHVDQKTSFNSFTKLNLTPQSPGGPLDSREKWARDYQIQQPDNSDKNNASTPQSLEYSWFTPLKDAKQTFEYAHTPTPKPTNTTIAGSSIVRLRPNPNEPIDIWQRRKNRNDHFKSPATGAELAQNKKLKGYDSDGLDDYSYIFHPDD